jgi:hypothetical protein
MKFTLILACLLLIWGPIGMVLGQERGSKPDPIALLRGVETSRATITSGAFEYNVKIQSAPSEGGNKELTLKIDLNGRKWRSTLTERMLVIDNASPDDDKGKLLAGMNYDRDEFVRKGYGKWKVFTIRSAYDGKELVSFHGESGATISNVSDPDVFDGFLFDARALGISVNCVAGEDNVRAAVAYHGDNRTASCVGKENVDGKEAWHVKVSWSNAPDDKLERHFWVGDIVGFPVYKVQQIGSVNNFTIVSHYDSRRNPIGFPKSVVIEETAIDGSFKSRTDITETTGEYGASPNDSSFGLNGMEMPAGTAVTDNRTSQRVGYWDGEKLVDEFVRPRAASTSYRWVYAFPAILALLAGVYWLRRRFGGSEKS